jgi:hypothetical protein
LVGNTNGAARIAIAKSVAPTTNPLDTIGFSGISIVNTNNTNNDLSGIALYTNNYSAGAGIFAKQTASTTADLLFYTGTGAGASNVERMRIDSSGNLLVGTTSPVNSSSKLALHTGSAIALETKPSSNGYYAAIFYNASSTVSGTIYASASSTAYNTSSDYRLKEDWQPMSGSIDRVKALNPVNFAWKADGSRVDGFLAHEAQEVVPEAVTGTKDAVTAYGNITDAEGTVVQEDVVEPETLEEGQTWTKVEEKPEYQGIDQSKLVPLLTSALQEAIARIETLEAEVTALKGA